MFCNPVLQLTCHVGLNGPVLVIESAVNQFFRIRSQVVKFFAMSPIAIVFPVAGADHPDGVCPRAIAH